ncbi:MAG: hypothetical protein PUG83_06750 [Clostridiaceae bacterium]|nr:hypothetical protein [Clostridiaceae bacterium]MDY5991851.1 hypothetical protein [Oscillospiraceae bacterium]
MPFSKLCLKFADKLSVFLVLAQKAAVCVALIRNSERVAQGIFLFLAVSPLEAVFDLAVGYVRYSSNTCPQMFIVSL